MNGFISLLVPANISEISLDTLIEFRNRNRERIKVFNVQINLLEDSIWNGITEKQFVNNFNDIYFELTREIVLMGIGLASIPFATYILINNPQALTAEYSNEILGALGVGLGGTYAVRRALFESCEKRHCKKYFTNLARLR